MEARGRLEEGDEELKTRDKGDESTNQGLKRQQTSGRCRIRVSLLFMISITEKI